MSQYDVLPDLNRFEKNGDQEKYIIELEESLMILDRARDFAEEEYRRHFIQRDAEFVERASSMGVKFVNQPVEIITTRGIHRQIYRFPFVPKNKSEEFDNLLYEYSFDIREIHDRYCKKMIDIEKKESGFKEAILDETEILPLLEESKRPPSVNLFIIRGENVYTSSFGIGCERPQFDKAKKLTHQMLSDPDILEKIKANGSDLGAAYRVSNPSRAPSSIDLASYVIGKLVDRLYDGRIPRMARIHPSQLN